MFALVHVCSVAQACPTLCDPIDCSLPGSSVHGFSRQEYWSGLLFSPPGDLPNPGIKPTSPALTGTFFPTESPGKPGVCSYLQPKAFSLTGPQYKWELWGLQKLRNWPKIPQVVDWDLSPDHPAPELHPSPTGGDTYLFGLLKIKCLAQMRIKLSTIHERIKYK